MKEEARRWIELGNAYRADLGCCGGYDCTEGHQEQLIEEVAEALSAAKAQGIKEGLAMAREAVGRAALFDTFGEVFTKDCHIMRERVISAIDSLNEKEGEKPLETGKKS